MRKVRPSENKFLFHGKGWLPEVLIIKSQSTIFYYIDAKCTWSRFRSQEKMKIFCRGIPTSELWKRFRSRWWFIYDKSRKWSHFLIMMTSNDLYQFWGDFRLNPLSLRFESGIEDFEQSKMFMAKNGQKSRRSPFLAIFHRDDAWLLSLEVQVEDWIEVGRNFWRKKHYVLLRINY